ncbi:NAD(P)-dependent oxidoreductase [Microbacterium album]|uniref:6-phosphogluconate dehydrogenase n=1 Tax=Microbacterium album TaxID=2053191 RepID=A0A917MMD0_9MICO|nr:NAD(P)-dependent oxidoreductase [Microbacterium album]GGH43752.1 6-phosphogluconate dehydrogenase [Microbacterium album]
MALDTNLGDAVGSLHETSGRWIVDAAAEPVRHRVGFISLGVMGAAMAARLTGAWPLLVWNRTAAATEPLAAAGAGVAGSPAEVFARCPVVILMLADERALDDVVRFDGSVDYRGTTVVQMGTVAPAYSSALGERLRAAGGRYVEAPVSGSRQPALEGALIAMVAGDDADVERVTPVLRPMCAQIFRCGAPPDALTMKLAVNTFLITLVSGLAEAFHFAERHRLDPALLERILAAGPMASTVSTSKAAKLAQEDWSVHAAIPDVLKNSRLIVDAARRSATASPLMEVCTQLFAEAERLGHDRDDMAAVVSAIRDRTARGEVRP